MYVVSLAKALCHTYLCQSLTRTHRFLDGDGNNAESLPITSNALQHIFETYNISHRFAFFPSKQRTASASMHYETESQQPRRLD